MQHHVVKLAPSILAADFARLGEQVAEAELDQVLVMTVNPGFGHQHFLVSTLPKIRRVAQMIEPIKPDCELEVDGGIDDATAQMAVAAGANVLVAGTSVFGSDKGVAAAMDSLREAVTQLA